MLYLVQLTLEHHRFELHGSTYLWIFFNKCIVQYCTIFGWFNYAEMWIWRADCEVILRFLTACGVTGISTLNPELFEGHCNVYLCFLHVFS